MDSLEQSEELRDSDRLDSAALLDVQVNYPPLSHRMLVLTCILVFEFFRNMAVQSIVLWVPMTLALNVYFFSQTNQDIDFEGYRHNRFLYVQVTLPFQSHCHCWSTLLSLSCSSTDQQTKQAIAQVC